MTDQNYGPSAGYGSNVEQNYGETGEKKGFMSKLKDKLLPRGPGETQTQVCLYFPPFLKGRGVVGTMMRRGEEGKE